MDDDEKSRRNLMVVSACVLLYLWLDIPANALQKRLLGVENFYVPPWKFWAILLCVTYYQLHRFVALMLESDLWKDKRLEWSNYSRKALYGEIDRLLQSANRNLELPREVQFKTADDGNWLRLGKMRMSSEQLEYERPKLKRWIVYARVSDEYVPAQDLLSGYLRFAVPWRREMRHRITWLWRQLFASPFTEIALPVTMGVASVGASAWNLLKFMNFDWV